MDGRHCTHLGYKRTRYGYTSPPRGTTVALPNEWRRGPVCLWWKEPGGAACPRLACRASLALFRSAAPLGSGRTLLTIRRASQRRIRWARAATKSMSTVTLEEPVDQRSRYPVLGQHHKQPKQHQHNHDGAQPPSPAQRHEGPCLLQKELVSPQNIGGCREQQQGQNGETEGAGRCSSLPGSEDRLTSVKTEFSGEAPSLPCLVRCIVRRHAHELLPLNSSVTSRASSTTLSASFASSREFPL
jgi:hypothetical protein